MNADGLNPKAPGPHVRKDIKPEWLRVGEAVHYSSISRTLLYELLNEGKIESRLLRKRGCLRGIRLVSVDSLETFIKSLPEGSGKED